MLKVKQSETQCFKNESYETKKEEINSSITMTFDDRKTVKKSNKSKGKKAKIADESVTKEVESSVEEPSKNNQSENVDAENRTSLEIPYREDNEKERNNVPITIADSKKPRKKTGGRELSIDCRTEERLTHDNSPVEDKRRKRNCNTSNEMENSAQNTNSSVLPKDGQCEPKKQRLQKTIKENYDRSVKKEEPVLAESLMVPESRDKSLTNRCTNSEDFRALTISMLSTTPYLTENLLVEYGVLTEELLRNGNLNSSHTSILVKAILLLNNIYYKPDARFMIYKLLHMISGNLDKLFFPHFMDLHKVVWKNLEPSYMIMELENIKKKQSLKLQLMNDGHFSPIYFYLVTLPMNAQSSLILQRAISEAENLESLLCILSNLTTTQMETCNMLWTKAADLLISKQPVDIKMLQRVCLSVCGQPCLSIAEAITCLPLSPLLAALRSAGPHPVPRSRRCESLPGLSPTHFLLPHSRQLSCL
ncbi:hypothetical protein J6590_031567 [Homalodisca vitripennis]|nr:hypothetical protein J6590_031567 [Homalodisca vitripennis]